MKYLLLTLLTILGYSVGFAQDDLPGDTTLPNSSEELADITKLDTGTYKYSVEDFTKKSNKSGFQFSPNGLYFSYEEKDKDGKKHVYVQNTETNEINLAIEEKEDLIRGYGWANDERLIYVQDKGGDENYHIYGVNLDGSHNIDLTPFEGVTVQISNNLKDQKDFMIIEMNKDNPQIFEPYKINITDGKLEKLYENKDVESPISGYEFDKDGNLRGFSKQSNGTDYTLFYRLSERSPFEEVMTTSWKETFSTIGFNYKTEYPHDVYALSNLENDTEELILYDLKEKKVIEKIYKNETYDIRGMSRSRKRDYEIDYYYYTGEKEVKVPVSESFRNLHSRFNREFFGYQYYITNTTDNEDKHLVYVESDRHAGAYYVYTVADDSFKKLMDLKPDLKENDMATMRPIKFTTRDGLIVHGYLTLPNRTEKGQKFPLIMNPHGGPYGPRDVWGFNPEVQLFASRGYATLQINYRGSGGYGKTFSMAGNKQIGRNMLNDLEDGLAHVISMGMIDEDKVAIYGASYGGLATLGSLVKTPDLYCCGVDYVGVSNLFTFFDAFPPYWKPYLGQVYEQWYNPNDAEDVKIMTAVSPALNVDKMTKPLFVVQGANDPRVNIDESDQVVKNLRERGVDVPYMVKYNEGHGFGHEENRVELYQVMLGFMSQYLK